MSLIPNPWRNYSPMRRREARAGLLFVLPWLLGLLIFTAYPVLATLFFSFTDYSVVQAPKLVGLDNYQTMLFSDPSVWKAVNNSLFYALLSVPLGLVLSLALAVLLNTRATGIGLYRTLFYLPSLVPPVASTIVFLVLFQPRGGLVNSVLGLVGLSGPAWFQDHNWANPGLVLLSLWGIGAATVIFLAGLQEVPASLLDAAAIDGAGAWQKFLYVSLPLLSPVILFNLVMGVIYSFQVFTQALVVGGTAGDPVESTLMFMVVIYRNAFRYFKMGYASTQAVALFVVVLVVTLTIFRTARVWVFTEADDQAA
jgi:multiple sugar transport system permease protein